MARKKVEEIVKKEPPEEKVVRRSNPNMTQLEALEADRGAGRVSAAGGADL